MSSRPTHRPPAWSGLSPRPPLYQPAPGLLADAVRGLLGLVGTLHHLHNAGDATSQMLRLDPSGADAPLFLKVVAAPRTSALARAEALAKWLQDAGADVVAGQSHGTLPDGRTLWSYPYLAGRSPQACAADLIAVGVGLARLHRGLASHPGQQEWRALTDRRLARLSATKQALAEGTLRAGPQPDRLAALARDTRISFAAEDHAGERTPLHGDLNLFNLMIVEGRCVFLDLEDVSHSVLPPVFDVATVFERVARADTSCTDADALLATLLHAYGEQTGTVVAASAIAPALRGLALRALCTLATSDPEGSDISEWNKFFHLMDLSAPRPA